MYNALVTGALHGRNDVYVAVIIPQPKAVTLLKICHAPAVIVYP